MEISKKELKKVSRKFRQLASRVIDAHHNEVNSIIRMLIAYIDETPVISDYIQSVYVGYPDLQSKISEVSGSYGRLILSTGDTPEEEVSSIYQILKFISENPATSTYGLGRGYTSTKNYQDMVKAFGNRVVMPFANEITNYLSDISTDMGYDEESKFMITVNGGQPQVNISNDSSTINATQNIQFNQSEADNIISELKLNLEKELSDNESMKNLLIPQVELIESEILEAQPKKAVLKTSIDTISSLLKTVPLAVMAAESAGKLYNLISPLFM